MRTWSRLRSRAFWALVAVAGAPAVAQAQQTGLFPLAPIRRERVPCPAEDPVYRLHREQYYGYFPTCWRRFPPGWGCLSPEAPNAAASFRELPRGNPPDTDLPEEPGAGMPEDERDLGPGPGREGVPAAPALPRTPPAGRNLFDLDTPAPAPRESNPPDIPQPGTPSNPPANRSAPPSRPGAAMAPLPAPSVGQAPQVAAPAPAPGSNDTLLALPEPPAAEAPALPATNALPPVEAPTGAMIEPAPEPGAVPEQAPQRRSLIGSLLGALRRR